MQEEEDERQITNIHRHIEDGGDIHELICSHSHSIRAWIGSTIVMKSLLDKGLNPSTLRAGIPIIIFAIHNRCIHVVRMLIEHGADVHAEAPGGSRNVMDYAILFSVYDAIRILLQHGAKYKRLPDVQHDAFWFYNHHKSLEVLVRVLHKDIVREFKQWILI